MLPPTILKSKANKTDPGKTWAFFAFILFDRQISSKSLSLNDNKLPWQHLFWAGLKSALAFQLMSVDWIGIPSLWISKILMHFSCPVSESMAE